MSDSRPALPIYALMMVAIAGGSTLLFDAPFESTRPVHEQTQSVDSRSMDAPGRLWQDPLTVALREHRRRADRGLGACEWENALPIRQILGYSDSSKPSLDDDAVPTFAASAADDQETCDSGRLAAILTGLVEGLEQNGRPSGPLNEKSLLILPVLVSEGYYQADVEARRRYRYAVAMALMRQEFMPLENRVLGHFVAPHPERIKDQAKNRRVVYEAENRLVAYEVMKRRGSQAVLVLWVPDHLAVPWPPEFLRETACAPAEEGEGTASEGEEEPCKRRRNVDYAVIGPASSDTLINLVASAVEYPADLSFLEKNEGECPADKQGDCERDYSARLPALEDIQRLSAQLSLTCLLPGAGQDPPCGPTNGKPEERLKKKGHPDPAAEKHSTPAKGVQRLARQVPLISPFASASGLRVIERVRKEHPGAYSKKPVNEQDYLSDNPLADSSAGTELLKSLLTAGCADGSRGRNCFSDFVQVRRDDAYVAWMLARELVARGVDTFDCSAERPRQSVALIGESDRVFTKIWLEEMWYQARLDCEKLKLAPTWKKSRKAEQKLDDIRRKRFKYKTRYCKGSSVSKGMQEFGCISSFTYLQGLDGSGANRGGGASSTQTSALGFETVDPKLLARPVGDSQFDYLRRLADEVREEDRLLRGNGGDGIRAIGIFGSDIYDKLLILQALRQELPDAIYFTNDLDARLMHPANYQWTRNVIVGSAFGLTVGHKLCRAGVPPFRDGYQSSTYIATMLALDQPGWLDISRLANRSCRWRVTEMPPSSASLDEEYLFRTGKHPGVFAAIDNWQVPGPRLFEISRTGVDDITPKLDVKWGDALPSFNEAVHGEAAQRTGSGSAILTTTQLFVALLVILLALTVVGSRIFMRRGFGTAASTPPWILNRKLSDRPPRPFPHTLFVGASLFALVITVVFIWQYSDDLQSAEGLFEIPVFDRYAGPREDVLERIDSERLCGDKNDGVWCAPKMPNPASLGLLALLPSLFIMLFWAAAIFLRWLRYTRHGDRIYHVRPSVFSLLLAVNVSAGFLVLLWLATRSPFFEQVSIMSGTSAWPSQAIQLIGIIIAIPVIFFSSRRLWQQLVQQVSDFFAEKVRFDPNQVGDFAPFSWGLQSELDKVSPRELLSTRVAQYVRYCRGSRRFARTMAMFAIYAVFAVLVYLYSAPPPPPIRGVFAQSAYWYLMWAVLPLLMFSAFFSTDATMMCSRLLRSVASRNIEPDFSDELVRRTGHRLGLRGDSDQDDPADRGVREYLRLDFIAQLTQPITPLIGMPFFLIAVLIVSRSSLFDNWHWELNVLSFTFVVAVFSAISAVRLRRAAEVARSDIVERLENLRRRVLSSVGDTGGISTHQVDALVTLVKSEERGAFNRWFKNPVVQALLLPFGGAGAIALLEFMLTVS